LRDLAIQVVEAELRGGIIVPRRSQSSRNCAKKTQDENPALSRSGVVPKSDTIPVEGVSEVP
jgi:hypothetical protein